MIGNPAGAIAVAHNSEEQQMPLEGHPYHYKTTAELLYIARDAHKAALATRGMDCECKYLDQVNDACTVLYWRRTNNVVR